MSFNFKPVAVVLGIAASLGAGFYWWQTWGMHPETKQFARIAIVPFDNLSSGAELDAVTQGIAIAVARQCEALPRARVFTAETESQALALGATHIALGTLDGDAANARMRWTLEIASRRRARESVEARHNGGDAWRDAAASVARELARQIRPEGRLLPSPFHNGAALRAFGESLLAGAPDAKAGALKRSVEADPQCALCWEALVQNTLQTAGPDAARTAAADALRQAGSGDGIDALRLRLLDANLRQDAAARTEAITKLAAALPGDPQVQIATAEVAIAQRKLPEAAAAYQRTWEAEPSRTDLLNQLGYVNAWMGRYDTALKWLDEYQRAEPDSANPADSRGEVLLMAGRFKEAEAALLASHEKDPNLAGGAALEKAALARWLNDDIRGAGELAEKYLAQRASQKDPYLRLRRVRWQFLMGQAREAEANLKLIAQHPDDPEASLASSYLALYALQAGDVTAAAAHAARARQTARNPLSVYASVLMTSLATGEKPPMRLSRQDDLQIAALSLTLQQKYDQAAAAWREALNATPANDDVLPREALAQALVALGRTQEATALVRQRWPLLSGEQAFLFESVVYPGLFYVRAEIAKAQGRPEEARSLFDQFIRCSGSRPDPTGVLRKARAESRL